MPHFTGLVQYGILAAVLLHAVVAQSHTANIIVKTDAPIHTTDHRYLSLGMDSNLIRNRWETFDFHSNRLKTLAKGLSPAFLRLSGTDGDRLIFNASTSRLTAFPNTTFSMTVADWDSINQFCTEVGWSLMFGFNNQIRHTNGNNSSWNPNNAIELLKYSIKRGYNNNLHFQLGNEPNLYGRHAWAVKLTGVQLADDFTKLRHILDAMFAGSFNQSKVVGPDVAKPTSSSKMLKQFVNTLESGVVQAVDFHHYYGGGANAEDYIDPARLDSYMQQVKAITGVVAGSKHSHLPVWNSEAGVSPVNSETGLESSFVATFQLVDHLGLSAKMGLDFLTRQTFYGLWLGLIDSKLNPNPPYWFALLFKRLVATRVLDVTVTGLSPGQNLLRLYAHCTPENPHTDYMPGAVTVYGMNLYNESLILNFGPTNVELFLLTADDLAGNVTYLNGVELRMESDTTLPALTPVMVHGPGVIVPPRAVLLVVVPSMKAQACL